MAILKYGNAAVVNKIVCPGKWIDTVVPKGKIKIAKDVITKFDPSKWLLSHVTIVASVDVEKRDKDPKKNFLIKPEYSIFVNNNGDCWERELLKIAAKSFIGADNFLEHVQIKELSKGKVIDVAIREIPFAKDNDGNDLTTIYVDVLIATNRKHTDLIEKIMNGEYSAVSMGCLIKYGICSQCGNVAEDESKACKHIRYFKNNYFYDDNGVKRIIAELCGSLDDPESCKFIDASWVRKPAFEGAVLNKIIPFPKNISDKIEKAVSVPSFNYSPGMYLKAAAKTDVEDIKEEEVPTDDIGFPEAPTEGDTPVEPESGIADVKEVENPSLGTQVTEEVEVEEPEEDATIEEVKNLIKRHVLNSIRREILEEEAKRQQKINERPVGLETSTNDNLVKKANTDKLLSCVNGSNKLYNALFVLSNVKNWDEFKSFGYGKDDVLGILYFLDTYSDNPMCKDIVKALSVIRYYPKEDLKKFFMKFIVEIGRRPTQCEVNKIMKWLKILQKFE